LKCKLSAFLNIKQNEGEGKWKNEKEKLGQKSSIMMVMVQ